MITRPKLTCRCGTEFRRFRWRLPNNHVTTHTVCPRCEPERLERCEAMEGAYGGYSERDPIAESGFQVASGRVIQSLLWLIGLCALAILAIEIARHYGYWS